MTEIEVSGNRIFIDNVVITGEHKPTVQLVRTFIQLLGQSELGGAVNNELTLVNWAVNTLDATIIKGDALVLMKQKDRRLY